MFVFALIPYFCLWVSVVWHSCSIMVIAMSGGGWCRFCVHVSAWYDRFLGV